jgi:hypothetical protein
MFKNIIAIIRKKMKNLKKKAIETTMHGKYDLEKRSMYQCAHICVRLIPLIFQKRERERNKKNINIRELTVFTWMRNNECMF